MYGFISGQSILFYWFLSLCHYHIGLLSKSFCSAKDTHKKMGVLWKEENEKISHTMGENFSKPGEYKSLISLR